MDFAPSDPKPMLRLTRESDKATKIHGTSLALGQAYMNPPVQAQAVWKVSVVMASLTHEWLLWLVLLTLPIGSR